MTEQFTNFANVRVEDVPIGLRYCAKDGWGASYRSPEKIKSVNGVMEYHYILEWTLSTPKSSTLIREEYFGGEVIYSSYQFNPLQIDQVGYSSGDFYFIEKDGVRKETPQPEEQPHESVQKVNTTDEKLDTVIGHLEKLLAKFPGGYRLSVDHGPADDSGAPLQYFGATPDEENPGRAIPYYIEDYLHAETLTGERIIVDGEEYLIMNDSPIAAPHRRFRVSKKTQIVHLMDYEKVDLYVLPVVADGWTISDGKVAIYGPNDERTVLPNGTKFKIVDYSDVINWGEVVPGTLAVRYPDYKYPSL